MGPEFLSRPDCLVMGYVLRLLGKQDFDAGTGYLLEVVDLHYLVMVVPNL